MESLYMYDYRETISEAVKMTVTETEKGVYQITIIPDDAWLQAATYPVTIDPTINSTLQSMTISDTYVSEYTPSLPNNYSQNSFMISGLYSYCEHEGLLSFELPTFLSGMKITYATLTLKPYGVMYLGRTIGLYQNTESFNQATVTWNEKPLSKTMMTDYHLIMSGDTSFLFDITKSVQEWISGTSNNYGFTIKDENGYGKKNSICSSENSGNGPIIEIGYMDSSGIKDYWTYSSQDAGASGVGYVSDYTGMLTFIRNEFTLSTEKQTLDFSLIYSVRNRGINSGYGYGWQTNYSITVGYDEDSDTFYSVDSTGSKVAYPGTSEGHILLSQQLQTGNTAGYYTAEDGSGNILMVERTPSSTIVRFYILTTNYIIYKFASNFNEIWYLDEIIDSSDYALNNIVISRSSASPAKINQIADGSGNLIVLEYISGMLSTAILKVKQSDNSYIETEKVEYSYTSGRPTSVNKKKDYNQDLSWTQEFYLHYTYDTSGRMTVAITNSSEKVWYIYNNSTSTIYSISSYYSSYRYSYVKYEYSLKQTKISDYLLGKYVIYKFDDYGHTVNLLDSQGVSQNFAYTNLFKATSDGGLYGIYTLYDGTPNYTLNHKLITESSPQITYINPIYNPGFDNPLFDGWTYVCSQGSCNRYLSTDRINGTYSAIIETTATNSQGSLSQTLIMNKGLYTLSGQVKNSTATGSDDDDVFIDIVGTDLVKGAVTYVDIRNVWTYVELFFVIENDATSVTIFLENQEYGIAYFDAIQIAEGFNKTNYDFIENASFEFIDENGNVPGWQNLNSNIMRAEMEYELPIYAELLGEYGLQINGDGDENRNAAIISEYAVNPIAVGGSILISSWAKSEGTPIANAVSGSDRFFRLLIIVYFEGGSTSKYLDFDSSIEGWQYNSVLIPIVSDDCEIVIFAEYKGEGTVFFDGIQAVYEPVYTKYTYDTHGRVLSSTSVNGKTTTYTYPAGDYLTRIPSELNVDGEITTIDSTNGQVNAVTYNNVTSTATYEDGQVTTVTTADETITYFSTSTTYLSTNFNQYISSYTNEFGFSTSYYYNNYLEDDFVTGLLKAVENAKGQETSYVYDDKGHLIKAQSVDNYGSESPTIYAQAVYEYDSQNRLTKIYLDYDNQPSLYYQITYDSQGRMSTVKINSINLVSYTYETNNTLYTNLVSTQKYGNNDEIKFVYNDLNQVIEIQYKDALVSDFVTKYTYAYDKSGLLSLYKEFDGSQMIDQEFYSYDSSNRLVRIDDYEGNLTEYIYDEFGNVASLSFTIDEYRNETQYSYDETSQIESVSYNSQSGWDVTKNYIYETIALKRLQNISLKLQTFNPDVEEELYTETVTYDGYTSRVLNIAFNVISSAGKDYKYAYAYDELGNIIHITYSEGTVIKSKHYYEYDELNQLVLEDVYINDNDSTTDYTKIYAYDARGNRVATSTYDYEYRETAAVIPNRFLYNYGTVDVTPVGYSTVKSIDVGGDLPALSSFRYIDDILGRTHTITTVLVSVDFDSMHKGYYWATYRATGTITLGTVNVYFKQRYKIGNLATTAGIPSSSSSYLYDNSWLDQLESYIGDDGINHTITYDNQGNPLSITNFWFKNAYYHHADLSWFGRGLNLIEIFDGSNTKQGSIEYNYNDQGYRTKKIIGTLVNGIFGYQTIEYELIGDKVIVETDGIYRITYTYDYDGTLLSYFCDDNIIDDIDGEEFFYIHDLQGNITAIIDDDGNETGQYLYDAYGNILNLITTPLNAYTYRGYRYDSEIKMYYLNSRYYNPQTGRFINADGMLGQLGDIQSTNMYAYCANNPVMYLDPSGEWAIFAAFASIGPIGWAIIAVVVIAAVVIATNLDILDGIPSPSNIQKEVNTKISEGIAYVALATATAFSEKFQGGYYVYTLSDDNGVFYVGITRNWDQRMAAHRNRFGSFEASKICIDCSLAQARVIETAAIAYFKSETYLGRNENRIFSISDSRFSRNILLNKVESDVLLLLGR